MMFNCFHPIYFPIWLPQRCSRGTKNDEHTNVLIPLMNACYITIASSGFFFWGAYGSLPDAVIWWWLRTGGGGVLTRVCCKDWTCEFLGAHWELVAAAGIVDIPNAFVQTVVEDEKDRAFIRIRGPLVDIRAENNSLTASCIFQILIALLKINANP